MSLKKYFLYIFCIVFTTVQSFECTPELKEIMKIATACYVCGTFMAGAPHIGSLLGNGELSKEERSLDRFAVNSITLGTILTVYFTLLSRPFFEKKLGYNDLLFPIGVSGLYATFNFIVYPNTLEKEEAFETTVQSKKFGLILVGIGRGCVFLWATKHILYKRFYGE